MDKMRTTIPARKMSRGFQNEPSSIRNGKIVPKVTRSTPTVITSNLLTIPVVSSINEPIETTDEKKLHPSCSIMKEFSLNTSTHGLPGIARSESIHNRIFWIISFLCFTAIMIYFITTAIIAYFTYPTQIDINIIQEWPQYFPAVSICNGSPFRLDRFIGPFFNYTTIQNLTNSSNATTIPSYLMSSIAAFIIDKVNTNQSLDSYFFPLSSMLYKCTFNSVPCTTADFIPFSSSFYGLCYTFNAKMKSSKNYTTVRYGNQYGGEGVLDLEFYVHSHQYVPYFWKGAGILALVHDNTQLPLVQTAGLKLTPGREHKLSYKKKMTYLLPSPYTSCTDNVPQSVQVMFDTYYNGTDYGYSETVCQQLCEQTYAYVKCGCINPFLWNARAIILPDTNKVIIVPVCNDISANPCYSQAVEELLSSSSLKQKYCSHCSQQCSITEFLTQSSAFLSPLEWQMNDIKNFVENSIIPLPTDWSTAWRTHIHTNYLAVSIVRETTIIENSTQSAQLKIVDILSNIGGQTGLWIGISFLSFMEFAEMIYRLIRYQCYLIKRKIQCTQ